MKLLPKPVPTGIEFDSFPASLEREAAAIPDGIDRLRFLRSSVRREKRRARLHQFAYAAAPILLVVLLVSSIGRSKAFHNAGVPLPTGKLAAAPAHPDGKVWLVERNVGGSLYSNGLQVREDFQTEAAPRRFRALSRATMEPTEVRTVPVGIVYHTSESQMVPFEPHTNESLRRYGLGLLGSARQNRLYNFVIDRFGRVYRVVPETQVANHAGHSIWADSNFVYLNLNQSFIAISFEAQTSGFSAGASEINGAQLHAGQVLTQMLRGLYGISGDNCVTHAQVSVNPSNMNIGYHTDWASRFPFRDMGLRDGYEAQVPAIGLFGFRYDSTFLQAIGGMPWKGIIAAEEGIVREASSRGMTPEAYRKTLQKKYKETIGGLSNMAAAEDMKHGQS